LLIEAKTDRWIAESKPCETYFHYTMMRRDVKSPFGMKAVSTGSPSIQ
jgi:hypothetical protein